MRLNKTLLAAAALVGASTVTSKAYDMYALDGALNPVWNYSQPSWGDANILVGQDFRGTFYQQLDSRLVNAGVYRGATGTFAWYWNEYWDAGWRPDYAEGSLGTSDNAGPFDYSYDFQSTIAENGSFNFDSATNSGESTNIAIGQTWVGVYGGTNGDDDTHVGRSITVFERTVQVARTGAGAFGANVGSAFESDNYDTSAFYNDSIVGRNVLITATSGATQLAGSVIRSADIALGFSGSEGLYAKDGGWLDIRGDLTLGSGGTIYIRDGEITANTYTQYYTPGTLNTVGVLTIQSGILSVRKNFAQDMSVTWDQTLGFRDGAVNSTRLLLEGAGYGFESGSQTVGPVGSSFGALRSITGENVQNGNISIVADGAGLFPGGGNGAVIGTDLGSKLTINGTVNGVNSGLSLGGAFLGYSSEGDTVQNGQILSGVNDVYKAGRGELLLTAANLFTGDLTVSEGSVRITNVGALSGATGDTLVSSGASLVLDLTTGFSIAENISIAGAGTAGTGAALYNKSGANTTTGVLTLTNSATVRVDASTSLTVGNIAATANTYTLTLDVNGADATAGSFNATGSSGLIKEIIKNGTGNATIATIAGTLEDVTVNAGKLVFSGSSSTALAFHDLLDVRGLSAGTLELSGAHHYGEFNVEGTNVLIKGSVTHHGDSGYDLDIFGGAVVTVDTGATLTTEQNDDNDASADIEDTSKLIVKGTFQANGGSLIDLDDTATLEVKSGGIVNSDIIANNSSNVTLRTGGTIVGNVDTYDSATYTVESGSTHTGDYNAYGSATIVINGTVGEGSEFAQNFRLAGSAVLKGSGTITGALQQTGGIVAPGNSVSILTVGGNYSISAGSLQIEIGGTSGAGVDPSGNDQLRVGGTATVGGTAKLDFEPYNAYVPSRGGVFQILANGTGASRATIGKFNTVETTGLISGGNEMRMIFDHSTGKAYGTGLIRGVQTFRDYGDNANRREIGRALWMESISRDNTVIEDENFVSTNPAINPDGLKTFILTTPTGPGGAEAATDLGTAAVSVLSAANVGEALDALSPEAYAGIAELGIRSARSFSQISSTKRRHASANDWDYSVGYSGEQITSSSSTSSFTNYKLSSDEFNVTASRDLAPDARLTLAVGTIDGTVSASGFNADTDTQAFGAGLTLLPASKGFAVDLGIAALRTDWDSTRGGAAASADNQDGLGLSLRVTQAATVDGALSYSPYIGLSYAKQEQAAVAEADASSGAGVGFAAYDRKSVVGEVGLKAEYALQPGTTLTGVLAWEHEFKNDGATTLDAEFSEDGATDTRFSVLSPGLGDDIFRIGVGLRAGLGENSSFSLSYDALISSRSESGQAVRADVSFRF